MTDLKPEPPRVPTSTWPWVSVADVGLPVPSNILWDVVLCRAKVLIHDGKIEFSEEEGTVSIVQAARKDEYGWRTVIGGTAVTFAADDQPSERVTHYRIHESPVLPDGSKGVAPKPEPRSDWNRVEDGLPPPSLPKGPTYSIDPGEGLELYDIIVVTWKHTFRKPRETRLVPYVVRGVARVPKGPRGPAGWILPMPEDLEWCHCDEWTSVYTRVTHWRRHVPCAMPSDLEEILNRCAKEIAEDQKKKI